MEALAEIAQVILNYANSQSSSDRIQKEQTQLDEKISRKPGS